jgi:hypothetical protein
MISLELAFGQQRARLAHILETLERTVLLARSAAMPRNF